MRNLGGDSHVKWTVCWSYLLGVKNAVLAPLMVFSLKTSAAEAFMVLFRVSSRENVTGGNVFFLEMVSFRGEKRFTPTKKDLVTS